MINAILAGLIATIIMTALMMLAKSMGVMRMMGVKMDLPGMLGSMVYGKEATGMKVMLTGLIMHLVTGSLLGGVFGYFVAQDVFFQATIKSAVVFSIIPWLIMVFVVLPMMGKGVLGVRMGPMLSVGMMTLILHLVYGASLGYALSFLF